MIRKYAPPLAVPNVGDWILGSDFLDIVDVPLKVVSMSEQSYVGEYKTGGTRRVWKKDVAYFTTSEKEAHKAWGIGRALRHECERLEKKARADIEAITTEEL